MSTLILILISCLWLSFALVFIIGSAIYLKTGFGKRLYHNKLGWHKPNEEIEAAGINFKSKCKYCGKEIIQDSQGNWF